MLRIILMFFVVFAASFATVRAQAAVSDADKAAITQTALDYLEGWYAGDGERMERALHPELAKRIVRAPMRRVKAGSITRSNERHDPGTGHTPRRR